MTTIVFRGGVLAADRRGIRGGWRHACATKIGRMPDGALYAICGQLAWGRKAVSEVSAGRDAPEEQDEGTLIVIRPNGVITVHEGKGRYDLPPQEFFSWGSGYPAALGALHMGADAVRAVEIAALVDPNTGDGVDAISMGE